MNCLQERKLELINAIVNDDDFAEFILELLDNYQESQEPVEDGEDEEGSDEEDPDSQNPFALGAAKVATKWGK